MLKKGKDDVQSASATVSSHTECALLPMCHQAWNRSSMITTSTCSRYSSSVSRPVRCPSVTVRRARCTPSPVDKRQPHVLSAAATERSLSPAETPAHHAHCNNGHFTLSTPEVRLRIGISHFKHWSNVSEKHGHQFHRQNFNILSVLCLTDWKRSLKIKETPFCTNSSQWTATSLDVNVFVYADVIFR